MNSKPADLSIVIPALNEEKRLGKTLDQLHKFLTTNASMRKLKCEVIVVNADSVDNTRSVALEHGRQFGNFRLLSPGKKAGKGRDVQYGMLHAKGNYVIFMDADLATPLRHLPRFYDLACGGYDVVVATRNLKKHHNKLSRRTLSIMGNLAYRILGGVWTEDSQCGFKLFSKQAAKVCFGNQTIMRWGFDMELLTIAKARRLSVKFVRINDWRAIDGGTFDNSQTLKNALETLHELLIIFKNRISLAYRDK